MSGANMSPVGDTSRKEASPRKREFSAIFSEDQLQPELNLPGRRRRRRDDSGGRVDRGARKSNRVWRAEVGVVQGVEEFCPELQAGFFGHSNVLQ